MNRPIAVSDLGHGMSVIIDCPGNSADNWMAYACWYSISKNLPEAIPIIRYNRSKLATSMFTWAYRCKVLIRPDIDEAYAGGQFLMKVVPVWTIAVRMYDKENCGPVDVKSVDATTFVSYGNECGKFIVSQWINRMESPLHNAIQRFSSLDMTVNEIKVLEWWQKSSLLFASL